MRNAPCHIRGGKALSKAHARAELAAQEKRGLRRILRGARDALSAKERAEADGRIFGALCATSQFQEAELVLTYHSIGSEVDTVRIIDRALCNGKRVALPRIAGLHAMDWHEISSLDGLVASEKGILEPAGDAASKVDPFAASEGSRMALVPALAFDVQGNRLGYGGGFYDRFLGPFKESGGTAWGLCRTGQVTEKLPQEGHDVRVDAIVTEDGIRTCPHPASS